MIPVQVVTKFGRCLKVLETTYSGEVSKYIFL